MSEPFEVGDVVYLKSGGPAMTVTQCGEQAMSGEMKVWCVWFDQKGTQQNGNFPPAAVRKEE